MLRQNNLIRLRGFTVVELLVVMGIIVIVAAVTLPTVKTLLSGRKVAEAANIVSSYAASAKSRAIATGRPVALIIDRLRYDGDGGMAATNTCTRLSIGDVFPAYTGDWAGATGTLGDASGGSIPNFIAIDLAQAASLYDSSTNSATGLVQAGDLIEFGTSREKYFINAVPSLVSGQVIIPFNNPPLTTNGDPMMEVGIQGVGRSVEFRIYRKPSKSFAGGVSLPRGTCIDLNFSGFGPSGRDFSSDNIHRTAGSDTTPYPAPYPPVAATDQWNFGAIYLVFTPAGTVDAWYFQDRTNSIATPIQQRGVPGGLIHLLVGSTDKVLSDQAYPVSTLGVQAALDASEETSSNLMDGENSWVTINPYTGGIHTSTVQATSVIASAPQPDPNNPASLLEYRISQARSLATNFLSIPKQGE